MRRNTLSYCPTEIAKLRGNVVSLIILSPPFFSIQHKLRYNLKYSKDKHSQRQKYSRITWEGIRVAGERGEIPRYSFIPLPPREDKTRHKTFVARRLLFQPRILFHHWWIKLETRFEDNEMGRGNTIVPIGFWKGETDAARTNNEAARKEGERRK